MRETDVMQEALEEVWNSLWNRADLSLAMVDLYMKHEITYIMQPLARSHQDVYRWAEMATFWPPDHRRKDRSYQWHQSEKRRMKKVEDETL